MYVVGYSYSGVIIARCETEAQAYAVAAEMYECCQDIVGWPGVNVWYVE